MIGAGLAGLAAACEAAEAGRRVIVLDQEPEQSLAGRRTGRWAASFWSTRVSSVGWG
ncbi:MAG: FAD-dependent oxidoreductase [Micropruina glycogenica]